MNKQRFDWGAYFKILIVFLIPVILAGCGYTASVIRGAGISSIYVPMFKNQTYEHDVHVTVTDAVINELILDGNLRLLKYEDADTILEGQVIRYKTEPLGYDKNNDVEQYRVIVTTQVVFRDLKKEDRKSTRLNSSHIPLSRMPSSA